MHRLIQVDFSFLNLLEFVDFISQYNSWYMHSSHTDFERNKKHRVLNKKKHAHTKAKPYQITSNSKFNKPTLLFWFWFLFLIWFWFWFWLLLLRLFGLLLLLLKLRFILPRLFWFWLLLFLLFGLPLLIRLLLRLLLLLFGGMPLFSLFGWWPSFQFALRLFGGFSRKRDEWV